MRGGFGVYAYGWSQDTYTTGIVFNAEGLGANYTGSLAESTQVQPVFLFSSTNPPLNYAGVNKAANAYNGQNASFFPYTPLSRGITSGRSASSGNSPAACWPRRPIRVIT